MEEEFPSVEAETGQEQIAECPKCGTQRVFDPADADDYLEHANTCGPLTVRKVEHGSL